MSGHASTLNQAGSITVLPGKTYRLVNANIQNHSGGPDSDLPLNEDRHYHAMKIGWDVPVIPDYNRSLDSIGAFAAGTGPYSTLMAYAYILNNQLRIVHTSSRSDYLTARVSSCFAVI
jgi:hypothetical protein